MRVTLDQPAREYIRRSGGRVYVRSKGHRCCGDTMSMLDVTTARPADADEYVGMVHDRVEVLVHPSDVTLLHQLEIVLRGVLRKQLVAYWDGCAYRM